MDRSETVPKQVDFPTAVLFVSDAKMLQRCETSIKELRTVGTSIGRLNDTCGHRSPSLVLTVHIITYSYREETARITHSQKTDSQKRAKLEQESIIILSFFSCNII